MNHPSEDNFERISLRVSGEEKAVMEQLWHASGHLATKANLTVLQMSQCLKTVASVYDDMARKSLLELLPQKTGDIDDGGEEGEDEEPQSYFRE
jgi:hypothetical protein